MQRSVWTIAAAAVALVLSIISSLAFSIGYPLGTGSFYRQRSRFSCLMAISEKRRLHKGNRAYVRGWVPSKSSEYDFLITILISFYHRPRLTSLFSIPNCVTHIPISPPIISFHTHSVSSFLQLFSWRRHFRCRPTLHQHSSHQVEPRNWLDFVHIRNLYECSGQSPLTSQSLTRSVLFDRGSFNHNDWTGQEEVE